MLELRQDQLQALATVSRDQFILQLAHELSEFAPPLAAVLGEEGARQLVLSAEATARAQNLSYRSSIRMVMQLMGVLGSEFTLDPQLPWVREILAYTHDRDELERTSLLHRRALAYLDEVHGPSQRNGIRALHRILDLPEPRRLEAVAARVDGFTWLAASVFPQKCEFVGEDALHALYQSAQAESLELELGHEGTLLLAALAFALGAGITRDPCYPWIARTLRGPGFGHGPRRTARLYRRIGIYALRVVVHLSHLPEDDAQV